MGNMFKNRSGESQRQRFPQPLIKSRIASGRGAMEQPNVTSDDAPLTPKFWVALCLTGVATGLFGIALMWVLRLFERLAFNYHSGSYSSAVSATSGLHRVIMLVISGLVGAVGWYFIRRYLKNEKSEIDEAVWTGDGELSLRRSFLTSFLSEIVIGLGASIGREAAPKLMGGVSGSVLSHWFNLTPSQKRLLVACGGGAGFAAVYNVPLGGAIFTAEVLIGSFSLPTVLPALACSLIATLTGWLYLSSGPTYGHIPNFKFSASIMVWSIFAGLIIGVLATGYVRLIGFVAHKRAKGSSIFWKMPMAFAAVGVVGIWYPELFGNGKEMANSAFLGLGSAGLLFMLFALKPFVTSVTLGSGAAGGLFTPFLSTGAALGAFLGIMWSHLWPGTPIGAYALVGAAAMIGAAMQAPLAGLVIVFELTQNGFHLMVPMVVATVIATTLVRQVDGYSIYSARLPRKEE
jgi:chloride channel protein, CIC family